MKKIVIMFTVIASLLSPFALSPAFASADAFSSSEAKSQACAGINGCTSTKSLDDVVQAVLRILSVIAGIASVIMIMISGYKYLTSGGDPGKVSSAKNTLVYAIIGIIIVAFSQFIAQFVIKQATTPPPAKKKAIVNVRMV
jgi:hypothetical protein